MSRAETHATAVSFVNLRELHIEERFYRSGLQRPYTVANLPCVLVFYKM